MKAKPEATLDALLGASAAANDPAFVAELSLRSGGVDPLGLRQVNFDLMDRVLPGLNNAATRLRPYVVVTWAWWKAFALFQQRGGGFVELDRLKNFVDRVEVLFVGSHLQAGEMDGLLGARVLNRFRNGANRYECVGPKWESFRRNRATTTSLMAPVAYGPSIRAGGAGLAFLRTTEEGVLIPMAEVMPAVTAFDKAMSKFANHPAFSTLDGVNVTLEDLERFHRRWRTDRLSKAEQEVGWRRLYSDPLALRRQPMIDVILAYLRGRRRGADVDELRRALARRARARALREPTEDARSVWRALQTQQLYRFALEALFVWVLRVINDRPARLNELQAELIEHVRGGTQRSFGDWIFAAPWSDLNFDPVADPVSLVEQIAGAEDTWVSDALDGLRAALRIARQEGEGSNLFGGQADRLPLNRALSRIDLVSEAPVPEALEVLISEWLIGQHIYWAVGRSGDDTQRLRLCLEEAGWTGVVNPSFPNPTPDRLSTVLSLMTDMGQLEKDGDGRFLAAA